MGKKGGGGLDENAQRRLLAEERKAADDRQAKAFADETERERLRRLTEKNAKEDLRKEDQRNLLKIEDSEAAAIGETFAPSLRPDIFSDVPGLQIPTPDNPA